MAHLQRCDLDRLSLFGRQPLATGWDQRNTPRCSAEPEVSLPVPNWPETPPLVLNRLYWPTGATRWATFVGLIDRDGLDQILATLISSRGAAKTLGDGTLILSHADYIGPLYPGFNANSNASQYALVTKMHLLPPRPVAMFDGHADRQLWYLPLVDERYWWQYRRLPTRLEWVLSQDHSDIVENDDPTEHRLKEDWRGWVRILSYALGLWSEGVGQPIGFDDDDDGKKGAKPETDYFYPDRHELDRLAYNAAALLDAVAWSCGRRVVRHPDGKTRLYSWTWSQTNHANNLKSYRGVGGGPITLVPGDKTLVPGDQKYEKRGFADNAKTTSGYAFSQAHPEFVDVTFRKLVEWGESSSWVDETDNQHPGMPSLTPTHPDSRVFYGPGVRVIRNSAAFSNGDMQTYVPGVVKTIHTPSWVGRVWYDATSTVDSEPRGEIDKSYYGDRYFRLAYQIAQDHHRWIEQAHEYQFGHLNWWNPTGFDDALEIDMQRGVTHVRSLPADVGVNSMLIQVHRQCVYRPDFFLGLVTSEWTAHPRELEPRPETGNCSVYSADGPTTEIWLDPCETGLNTDYWARSWEWMSATARPLIPCDPWAAENSIEYGKRFAHLGDPVTVTVRSHKLVQQLKDLVGCAIVVDGDGEPVLDADGNVIFDRTDCLPTANGLVTAERYGCEWVVTSIECN